MPRRRRPERVKGADSKPTQPSQPMPWATVLERHDAEDGGVGGAHAVATAPGPSGRQRSNRLRPLTLPYRRGSPRPSHAAPGGDTPGALALANSLGLTASPREAGTAIIPLHALGGGAGGAARILALGPAPRTGPGMTHSDDSFR